MKKSEYRLKLWAKDKTCFVCKKPFHSIEETTIEHIIPQSRGGTYALSNLALSHEACNKQKGANLLVEHSPEEYMRLLRTLKELIKGKDKLIKSLSDALRVKKSNLQRISVENDFMRKRIKECFGVEGYLKVMAHTECPGGFDIENFKKVHGMQG